MKRREFSALVGGAVVWPYWVSAQVADKSPLVAVLVEGRQASFPLTARMSPLQTWWPAAIAAHQLPVRGHLIV